MKSLTLTFTEDEAEILVDALDADIEGYEESIAEARSAGNRGDIATFTEAADRIRAVRDRLRTELGIED